MYICVCNSITDRQIKKAVQQGHTTFDQIQEQLQVATCCGCCKTHAKEVIHEARIEQKAKSKSLPQFSPPLFYAV